MKSGKLPPELLTRLVLPFTGASRPEVLVPAATGEDAAVLDFGEWACVASTDPITGAGERSGWYAVHVACNDLAATGSEPVAVLLTLLLPESASPEEAQQVMAAADEAARSIGVAIVGGHTEVTSAVNRLVISATALGRAPKSAWLKTGGARPGDFLILTKAAGLEGTAILAADLTDRLSPFISDDVLNRARGFASELSVVGDAAAAVRGGASAMHDATEGGVLGAACEMAIASGIGVEVWSDQVPVRIETKRICEALQIDPLRLISSGALLVAASDGEQAVSEIRHAGIQAAIIGRFINSGYYITEQTLRRTVTPSSDDELWRVLA